MFLIEPSLSMEMPYPQLIADKLVMPSQAIGVSRPRLLSLLQTSLDTCTSTILSARAGAGKTTLAIDFAGKSKRAVAWYKVDAADMDLIVFLQYLNAAIRARRDNFWGQKLIDSLRDRHDEGAVLIAERLVYELSESCGEPLLVVIEDLHLVCDSPWVVPFFRRLLPLLPADVHILITSRTMPPTALWRMRSKQTLTVIDDEILKFNRPEAIELFESYGLSREQACIALDHTRGRAATLASFAQILNLSERRATDRINEAGTSTVPNSG